MFTLENKVNGMLIGFAHVYRKSDVDPETSLYSVEYHRPSQIPPMMKFNLRHKPKEGAEKLSFLIYQRLNTKLKKLDSLPIIYNLSALENRANSLMLGFADVINEYALDGESCLYSVEYHRPRKTPPVITINVLHKPQEGAEKLSFLIYKELDKRLKKLNKK